MQHYALYVYDCFFYSNKKSVIKIYLFLFLAINFQMKDLSVLKIRSFFVPRQS